MPKRPRLALLLFIGNVVLLVLDLTLLLSQFVCEFVFVIFILLSNVDKCYELNNNTLNEFQAQEALATAQSMYTTLNMELLEEMPAIYDK